MTTRIVNKYFDNYRRGEYVLVSKPNLSNTWEVAAFYGWDINGNMVTTQEDIKHNQLRTWEIFVPISLLSSLYIQTLVIPLYLMERGGLADELKNFQGKEKVFTEGGNILDYKSRPTTAAKAASSAVQSVSVGSVLNERATQYGSFEDNAHVMQAIKTQLYSLSVDKKIPSHVKESMEMIVHRLVRIFGGDYKVLDSWVDIQGYAKLTEDILRKDLEVNKKGE